MRGKVQRFETLDGFRGLAAIAVALRHVDSLFDVGINLARSYLAVDLFFVLSGFVIAYAYENRLRHGLSAGDFIWARLARLYPLYLLGAGIGLAVATAAMVTGRADWTIPLLMGAASLGALWLPFPAMTPNGAAPYPLNAPSWSLFFELAINAVYALVWQSLTVARLALTVALSAGALAVTIWFYGSANLGWDWGSFVGGGPRVAFSFFAGVLIFRLRDRVRARIPASALLSLLLICLWTPVPEAWVWVYDCCVVLIVFPTLVLLGAAIEPSLGLAEICRVSGRLSYPLYMTHVPLLALAYGVLSVLGVSVPFAGLAVIAGLLVAAFLADRWFDRPARSLILRSLAKV